MWMHFVVNYAKMKIAFGVKTFKECERILHELYDDVFLTMGRHTANVRAMVIWDDGQPDMRCHKYGISYSIRTWSRGDADRIHTLLYDILDGDVKIS